MEDRLEYLTEIASIIKMKSLKGENSHLHKTFRICMTQYQHVNRKGWVWRESAKRTCACMKLQCPFQQSPSCGAHWWTGLLVWPPYVEVWGPDCHRSSGTWRAVGGHTGGGVGSWEMLGGQLLHQYCTRRTRAEQDPAGEWGAFSKERSTGATFLTPHSLYPSPHLLSALPFSSILLSLAVWYTGWNVIFLCLSYETALSHFSPCIPPTPLTNPFSTGIKLNHGALFFNHHVHIKVTHERM